MSTSLMPTLGRGKYIWTIALGWLGYAVSTNGEPVIFSAMGCGPYTPADRPAAAFYVQQENRERTSEFMVHLGDVFKNAPVKKTAPSEPPSPDRMPTEAEYRQTAELLTEGNTIPTWVVPGDNEWNDLEDPGQ